MKRASEVVWTLVLSFVLGLIMTSVLGLTAFYVFSGVSI